MLFLKYRYIFLVKEYLYVCYSSSHCSLWSSAFIVVVLVNMTSNNGLCVSLICQDQSVAMGCGSRMHGVSCGAVFAAEVAVFVLRGASDGSTLLSTPVIESILTSAAQVVRKAQSMGKLAASPFECLSAVLFRDEVAATIQECVCVLPGRIFYISRLPQCRLLQGCLLRFPSCMRAR